MLALTQTMKRIKLNTILLLLCLAAQAFAEKPASRVPV
ncbi:MAG: hypothetical protein ACI9TH_004698 [Kiritimatiellia bacterium]|jgi:hypothetical protein